MERKEVALTDTQRVADFGDKLLSEVSKVIVGKDDLKQTLLIALLAGGHVLIEGLPGTAKTKLARTFAEVIGGQFKRIQFTPDMLPADITGFYFYSPNGNTNSQFIEGPIFTNILLADELNRATPRTQSALLEAMQEYQVTVERETHQLFKPFMVIATQQEVGAEGTYPLANVQADRFLLRNLSEYGSVEEEKEVIANIDRIDEPDIQVVTSLEEVKDMWNVVKAVHVSPDIMEYIMSIIDSLRSDPDVESGPSTRGGIALYRCSRVTALLDGRDFVIPDDIKKLASLTVEHRIQARSEAEMDEITPGVILERTLEKVPVPKVNV